MLHKDVGLKRDQLPETREEAVRPSHQRRRELQQIRRVRTASERGMIRTSAPNQRFRWRKESASFARRLVAENFCVRIGLSLSTMLRTRRELDQEILCALKTPRALCLSSGVRRRFSCVLTALLASAPLRGPAGPSRWSAAWPISWGRGIPSQPCGLRAARSRSQRPKQAMVLSDGSPEPPRRHPVELLLLYVVPRSQPVVVVPLQRQRQRPQPRRSRHHYDAAVTTTTSTTTQPSRLRRSRHDQLQQCLQSPRRPLQRGASKRIEVQGRLHRSKRPWQL